MANTDAPFGLRAVHHQDSSPYNGTGGTEYYIPTTDTNALFIGDPVVKMEGANPADIQGIPAGFIPAAIKATVGGPVTGVVVGFVPATQDSQRYKLANSTAAKVAIVCDSPRMVFEAQTDAGTAFATTMIGQNVNLTYATAGSTATAVSGAKVDLSTVGTAATGKSFKILGLGRSPLNSVGAAATVLLLANSHTDVAGATGV